MLVTSLWAALRSYTCTSHQICQFRIFHMNMLVLRVRVDSIFGTNNSPRLVHSAIMKPIPLHSESDPSDIVHRWQSRKIHYIQPLVVRVCLQHVIRLPSVGEDGHPEVTLYTTNEGRGISFTHYSVHKQ